MSTFELETALSYAYNAIIVVDAVGEIIFSNQTAGEIFNIYADAMLGIQIRNLAPDILLEQVAADGKSRLNIRLVAGDRHFIVNCSPILREDKIVGAVAVFHDVTELQRAVQELQSTRDKLTMLEMGMEHLKGGVVIVDKEGRIKMITDHYARFLGVEHDKVISKPIAEVIENTRLHLVMKTGKAEIGAIQHVKGKDIVVMRRPIISNGEIIGAIGEVMFEDVTDLKKLAEGLHLTETKLEYYEQECGGQKSKYNFSNIVGESAQMVSAKQLGLRVSQSRSTVLIQGESGTGKELIAHAIHGASPRKERAFIRVNCAAIPKDLLEAELFGYVEGAFTGAKKGGKIGKIGLANKGTIFLDEIGDMPVEMQMKLLRVLQEGELERVGGTKIEEVDVRVIAATNRDLQQMVLEGKFRKDLYYRLNVVNIFMPPLREHPQDIPILIQKMIDKLNSDLGTAVTGVSSETEKILFSYHWPGNARELENVLERAMNVMESSIIEPKDLPIYLQEFEQTGNLQPAVGSLEKELELAETRAIKQALKLAGGNKIKAAKILNIHRATFYRKLEKYRLDM